MAEPDLEELLRRSQDKLRKLRSPLPKPTLWEVLRDACESLRWWLDMWPAVLSVAVVAAFLGMFVGLRDAQRADKIEYERLMAQCMADGKKEYQCVGILKSNDPAVVTVPMPIIMPVR